jgi:hypothetical protein
MSKHRQFVNKIESCGDQKHQKCIKLLFLNVNIFIDKDFIFATIRAVHSLIMRVRLLANEKTGRTV